MYNKGKKERKMMKTMLTHAGRVYADYTLDDSQPNGIMIHRVYRDYGDRKYIFEDPRMVESARFSIRGQLDGWMRVSEPKPPRKRG